MADSIRERVIQALQAKLEDISLANGYSFDPTVERAPVEVFDPSLDAVTIWDQDEETVHRASSMVQSMTVEIQTMREAGEVNFSVIGNQSLADIKRAVFSDDSTMGGIADGINLESSTIEYPDGSTGIVKTTTDIVVMYSESRGDPATQPL